VPVRLPEKQSAMLDEAVRNVDVTYRYPYGLDLKPKTKLHDKLVQFVMNRVQESHDVMKSRHSSWQKIDHTLTAYIPLDTEEEEIQAADERKPVSVVIPMTYAILETLVTRWVAALLTEPIFQYDGAGPEDRYVAIMMEKLVELQSVRQKFALALYTQFRSALAYGFGVVVPDWHMDTTRVLRREPIEKWFPLLGNVKFGERMVEREEVLYEGNRLTAVDPYLYFPDPNVPIHEPQRGEFVSWLMIDNIPGLLKDEEMGQAFNAEYCKRLKPCTSAIYSESEHGRNTRSGISADTGGQYTSPAHRIRMCAKVIPRDLGIGESRFPEPWMFEVSGDCVLTGLYRLRYAHGMLPAAVLAPDTDGFSVAPTSRLETVYGCQVILDFFLNSMIRGIRKTQHDMLIADPLRVHLPSLEDPDAGRIILTSEAYWGQGVKDAVDQLKFYDVSSNNVSHAAVIMDIMRQVTGAVETLEGRMQNKSESPTATEVDLANSGAVGRLQKSIKIGAIQSMYDLAMMLAHNTQQFTSVSRYVETTGRWETVLREEFGITDNHILVDPEVFQVARDIVPHNQAIPGGQNVQGLLNWFNIVASNEVTAAQTDLMRLAMHVGRELGVQNAGDFRLRTQVMPDAEVAARAQAGDLAPVDQAMEAGVL